MISTCKFCGTAGGATDRNCASLEEALQVSEFRPHGCSWLSEDDRRRLTEKTTIIDWKARAMTAEAEVQRLSERSAVLVDALKFALEIMESYAFSSGTDHRTATPESAIGRARAAIAAVSPPEGSK